MAELKTKKVRHYRVMSNLLGITRYGFDSYAEAKREQQNLWHAEEIVGALQVCCSLSTIEIDPEHWGGPIDALIVDGECKNLSVLYDRHLKKYLKALGTQLEALDNTIKELNLNCMRANELVEASRQLERQYRLLKEALRNSLPGKEELQ